VPGAEELKTAPLCPKSYLDNMLNTTYYNYVEGGKRMYEIVFYDSEDGKCPIQEFLDSLEPKLLAKTLRTIDLLENNGPQLREPYSKMLEDGIFELRTKQSSDITRVLYFFFAGRKVVLTNGFVKKSQKTPKTEKELAKKYKTDYERRYGNEQL
jgi:phage-related protein